MKTIVIEGPDGAGKSTLVEAIQNAGDNVECIHPGKPPTEYEQLLFMLNSQLNYRPQNILVYDRITAISEAVYRPFRIGLKSDEENECAVYFSLLEAQLAMSIGLNWTFIYCRPSVGSILSMCHQYNENDTEDTKRVVASNIYDVVISYDALMQRLKCYGCNVIVFNYEEHDLGALVQAILE